MAEINNQYNAAEIEVLTGLDPVKKRPGMYTETSRPNHLVQEALDNSVDEAKKELAKLVPSSPEVGLYLDFIERSKRGLIRSSG